MYYKPRPAGNGRPGEGAAKMYNDYLRRCPECDAEMEDANEGVYYAKNEHRRKVRSMR
jgi:hypothetical protein